MILRKNSKEQIIEAVATSTSICQALRKLQLKPAGGNYRSFHNLVKEMSLDTSHFTGQASNKGKCFGPKRPIEDYLSNKFPIGSYRLKKRLLHDGLLSYKCHNCNLEQWLGKLIPLELEHKDGNHLNNNLDNLCLLCPNCHSLTPTFRGKNIRKNPNP